MNNLAEDIEKLSRLGKFRSVDVEYLKIIEDNLNIILPKDLKEITKHYSGEMLGAIEFFNFNGGEEDDYSIISKTNFYRKIPDFNLPHQYIPLHESEVSFVVLETQDSPEKPTPIIWCSIEDAYHLAAGKPLEDNPTIFPSFTDFFEYLLDEEEKMRAEQA